MIMRVHLIQSIKLFFIFICFVTLIKCATNEEKESSSLTADWPHVLEDILNLHPAEGLVYFKNKAFTGYGVKFYNKELFSLKISYVNGLKQGKIQKWFSDGQLSYNANYAEGRLHGKSTTWWRNGKKRSESNHINGSSEGVQMQWYNSGSKFKRINLVNGKENGIQKSWRENGKLYNNYEAKNGRIFGMKRASLCYQLEDEEVQY